MFEISNYIAGQWLKGPSNQRIDNYEPRTGQIYSHIIEANSEDVNKAVEAARLAFKSWSKIGIKERLFWIDKLTKKIESHQVALGQAESRDQGKPEKSAIEFDARRAALFFKFFSSAVQSRSSLSFTDTENIVEYINRPPLGPCAIITPWNYPLSILCWKLAPCLLMGNTAVCKPSELTPMTAYLLAKILDEIDFPAGVVNIIQGSGETVGRALVAHPDIKAISFTGGTQTGKDIALRSAAQFKKISLELGGKNPNIVFADCDFDKALKTTLRSSFLNQGEICTCGSRIYVEEPLYEKFVEKLVEEANELRVGDPKHPKTFLGAMISKDHMEKIQRKVSLAEKEGALRLTQTNLDFLPEEIKTGYYMRPSVLTDVPNLCDLQVQELFGPVVSVTPFKEDEEALELANSSEYGLSASLWTSNLARSLNFSKDLQAGTVWVNSWMQRNLRAPFGGMKSSGMGREGGDSSLDFFSETQNVSCDFSQPKSQKL